MRSGVHHWPSRRTVDLVATTTLVARDLFERLADDAFGAVGRRGVDEIDAKIDGVAHEPRRLLLVQTGFEPHAGKAAGAEPGDADAQAGFAESGVLHYALLLWPAVDPKLAFVPRRATLGNAENDCESDAH